MNLKRIGELLRERMGLPDEHLRHALEIQSTTQPRPLLGSILLSFNYIDEQQLTHALAGQMGVDIWDLREEPPDASLKSLIPPTIAQEHMIIPQGCENGYVRCVVTGPVAPAVRSKIEFLIGQPIRMVIASETDVLHQLQTSYGISVENMISGLSETGGDDNNDGEEYFMHDLREMAQEPTLINLVNLIISGAIEERASDIHIEPFESTLTVKYRIDGLLHEMSPPPKQFQSAIVSRIKIMAGMDIAERYIPQDGHIRVNLPHAKVDIRVSTVPTVYGESLVLRLLNKDEALMDLNQLGMSDESRTRFTALLDRPFGIILVCGPTGCGKTTTLYSALRQIYTPEKKIITIEDPVEYKIQGVNQIPVRPKRGLTFASGLRAIVRQDPDIIMVGEVRDRETADIAIRAALTGHLVFSTLHTNDAPGAITRLLDMGVEPFLIASSTQGIIGQRLMRRLCPECRRPVTPDPILLRQFEIDSLPDCIYEPVGCDACHGRGYRGRFGVFELLTINETLHDLILRSATSNEIKRVAHKDMQTMRQDGWEKIRSGVTSLAEVMRATQMETNGEG